MDAAAGHCFICVGEALLLEQHNSFPLLCFVFVKTFIHGLTSSGSMQNVAFLQEKLMNCMDSRVSFLRVFALLVFLIYFQA
jgi:vacuolar-type H+-ATPase subunit I/STV1